MNAFRHSFLRHALPRQVSHHYQVVPVRTMMLQATSRSACHGTLARQSMAMLSPSRSHSTNSVAFDGNDSLDSSSSVFIEETKNASVENTTAAPDSKGEIKAACGTIPDDDEEEEEQEEMFVDPYEAFEHGGKEWGGPRRGGRFPEPTRYGDWERKGRCTDF